MTYHTERALARDAARQAASLCLAVRGAMLGAPERMDKAGHEPVTVADFGAQAVIGSWLAERFPADRVLAEESAADFDALAGSGRRQQVVDHVAETLGRPVTPDEVRRWLDHGREAASARVWMVDPIDGTKGFLRGDQFAVAIGLAVDGELVVGALACPKMPLRAELPASLGGLLVTAAKGEGASTYDLFGSTSPLRAARVSEADQPEAARAVQSVESAHGDPEAATRTWAALGLTRPPLRIDSQAKYAAVADGRAEVYLRTQSSPERRERVWDHAAGALIVAEAGGRVTDLYGEPLDFSQGARLEANRGVLATNGHLHEAALAALRAAGVTN